MLYICFSSCCRTFNCSSCAHQMRTQANQMTNEIVSDNLLRCSPCPWWYEELFAGCIMPAHFMTQPKFIFGKKKQKYGFAINSRHCQWKYNKNPTLGWVEKCRKLLPWKESDFEMFIVRFMPVSSTTVDFTEKNYIVVRADSRFPGVVFQLPFSFDFNCEPRQQWLNDAKTSALF